MPFSQGIHAWIEVDSEPLPEYKTQVDTRRTTCFIPSEEGKKFCVRFQNVEPAVAALRGNIFLDGLSAGSGLLLSTDTHAAKISGQTRWEGFERPFQFSKLRTTDDESEACQDETRLRELGTVRVQMEWVEVVRQEVWRAPASPASANQLIFERSKKAISHCVSFGELEAARPKHWYSTRRLFNESIEFVFQYAPKDWLQAQAIVTSSLVPASKRAHDTATGSEGTTEDVLDEAEAIAYRRLRAKLALQKSRKRQKVVKSEPRDDPGVGPFAPGQIIDLTGED